MEGKEEKDWGVDKVIEGGGLPSGCRSVRGEGVLQGMCAEGTEGYGGGTGDGCDEEVVFPHGGVSGSCAGGNCGTRAA